MNKEAHTVQHIFSGVVAARQVDVGKNKKKKNPYAYNGAGEWNPAGDEKNKARTGREKATE